VGFLGVARKKLGKLRGLDFFTTEDTESTEKSELVEPVTGEPVTARAVAEGVNYERKRVQIYF
jgi:hypothetical protein